MGMQWHLQKIGHMMGISKGSVNDYAIQACSAILKHYNKNYQMAKQRRVSKHQWMNQKGAWFR